MKITTSWALVIILSALVVIVTKTVDNKRRYKEGNDAEKAYRDSLKENNAARSAFPSKTATAGQEIRNVKGLRIGMEYKHKEPVVFPVTIFSWSIYVFRNHGVSVYKEIAEKGDIARLKNDGSLLSSAMDSRIGIGAPKGAVLMRGTDEDTRKDV